MLTDDALIIGAEGTGKTSLGLHLVEASLKLGHPAVVIDLTGDLARPLTESSTAGSHVRTMDFPIVMGMFSQPIIDTEISADEVVDLLSALLEVLGYRARRFSPEFALLEAIVHHSWSTDTPVGLDALAALVQTPPIDEIGLYRLDEVISPDRRQMLATAILGLLVYRDLHTTEPTGFRARDLLYDGDTPTVTVVCPNSLSPRVREFLFAVLLAKLRTHLSEGHGPFMLFVDEASTYLPQTRSRPAPHPRQSCSATP